MYLGNEVVVKKDVSRASKDGVGRGVDVAVTVSKLGSTFFLFSFCITVYELPFLADDGNAWQ